MNASNNIVAAIFAGALIGSPIGVFAADTTTKTPADTKAPAETKKPAQTKKSTAKADRLDVNTASLDQLKAIRGLDEAQAKKIVEGRPYKRRGELLSRKIVTQETYDKIKDRVSTRAPGTKAQTN
jgi:competence protein ComEA